MESKWEDRWSGLAGPLIFFGMTSDIMEVIALLVVNVVFFVDTL